MPRVIYLHAEAPPKPAPGRPCNGCGVCCASEPCPLGMLASRRRRGACRLLRWDAGGARYRCGLLDAPGGAAGPLRRHVAAAWRRFLARRIGAGQGCDASLEAVPADAPAA
ncbi:hypothetical protein [Piscinibacter sakaiensis]|uniref:Ferredoxin n=1 Tax=Piscinibacter sakaiensis TaxID=1547922 RepID=A0A0K8P708_PISS1|nr:hypothetical protein [Piscinibacter sakaiensis]GAP38438.1 ferredoxin [Piscinibacter sakaiensis]